jgi:uncharacterized oligopeptide transporter (OPT) family protein
LCGLILPRKRKEEAPVDPGSEIPVEEALEVPKRSPFTKRAIVYGLFVGVLYTFLIIYISLKTGISFIAGTMLFGYILLSIKGKYDPSENVVVTSIAEGSVLVGGGVIASLPAIVIYSSVISQKYYDPIFYLLNPIYSNLTPIYNFLYPINPYYASFFSSASWYTTVITPQLLITIGLFAGVAGLFLMFPFRNELLNMPWPGAVSIYRTIGGLGDVEQSKNRLLKGMGVAAAYTGIFTVLSTYFKQNLFLLPQTPVYPSWLTILKQFWLATLTPDQQTLWTYLTSSRLPNFLGIANQPLIMTVGYFMGWKRTLALFAGAVWSMIVWLVWEQASPLATYGTHIAQTMIYYTAIGVIGAFVLWEIILKNALKNYEDQKKMRKLREQVIKDAAEGKIDAEQAAPYLAAEKMSRFAKSKQSMNAAIANFRKLTKGKKISIMILSVAIFAIGTILIFSTNNPITQNIWGYKVLNIPWYLTLAASPLLALSGYVFTVSVGEAYTAANYLTDSLVVPAIILLVNFPSIIVLTTILSTWQQSTGNYMARLKVGRVIKVKDSVVTKSLIVGIVFGAFVAAFIIMQLYEWGGFGTATFPAPAAQITGLIYLAVMQAYSATSYISTLVAATTTTSGIGLASFFSDPITWSVGMLFNAGIIPASLRPFSVQISNYFKPFYLQSWFIGTYPTGYGWLIFGVAGFVIGLVLARYNWSPISLAVGLLITPAYSITIFLGGVLNYYVYRRNKANQTKYLKEEAKYTNVLAGVATGDGVAQILWILSQIFII